MAARACLEGAITLQVGPFRQIESVEPVLDRLRSAPGLRADRQVLGGGVFSIYGTLLNGEVLFDWLSRSTAVTRVEVDGAVWRVVPVGCHV